MATDTEKQQVDHPWIPIFLDSATLWYQKFNLVEKGIPTGGGEGACVVFFWNCWNNIKVEEHEWSKLYEISWRKRIRIIKCLAKSSYYYSFVLILKASSKQSAKGLCLRLINVTWLVLWAVIWDFFFFYGPWTQTLLNVTTLCYTVNFILIRFLFLF